MTDEPAPPDLQLVADITSQLAVKVGAELIEHIDTRLDRLAVDVRAGLADIRRTVARANADVRAELADLRADVARLAVDVQQAIDAMADHAAQPDHRRQ